ncbi:MAG: dihydrolipoyl dehydrogenase [Bacteroides sp.]|nr:MAG: dihydrolipoyl dehydrogenase [Bacteroides sp.]
MVYDIAIIGGGPGGYTAAIRAVNLGLKTVIIEKDKLGGICLNWGCIPTKSLIKSVEVLEYIQKSESYGISLNSNSVNINFNKIIDRSKRISSQMENGIKHLMTKNNVEIIYGNAFLNEKNKIEISFNNENIKKQISSKNIIIATGAKPKTIFKNEHDNSLLLYYKEILSLKELPKDIVIIGSGAIGIEFAYFFNALGVKVTIIEYANNILNNEDEDISNFVKNNFTKKGINIINNSLLEKVLYDNIGMYELYIKNILNNNLVRIKCNMVFSAIGIVGNYDNIGIDNIGIKCKNNKILVDKNYQTNINGYYAIGDVIDTPSLAHVASMEGINCIEYISGVKIHDINYNNIPYCTYCNPEIASIGLTEQNAIKKGYKIKIGKVPFNILGKANSISKKHGFMKIIYDDKYGEILGAHIIGHNATEIISSISLGKTLEATYEEILQSIYPHPTISEIISESTGHAYNQAINYII